ncbi:MAG: hypothetical protein M9891_05420 [Austwickia sp.]|nr:hypothetical protein [Austwickia sp.]
MSGAGTPPPGAMARRRVTTAAAAAVAGRAAGRAAAAGRATAADALIILRRLAAILRAAPATLILAGWLVVANAIAHLLPPTVRGWLDATLLVRAGEILARPWTPLSAVLLPASPLDPWVTRGAVATLAVLVILGVPAERRLGVRRYLGAALAGQVVGAGAPARVGGAGGGPFRTGPPTS